MQKAGAALAAAIVGLATTVAVLSATASAVPAPESRETVRVIPSPGWNIYDGGVDNTGYRYGPSVIINDDGSVDMWTCAPGDGAGADNIRYRHSSDGGHDWTADQVVLQRSAGTLDNFSVCDPGVVYDTITGYYYMGYTGAAVTGENNDLFVARALHPKGPFFKWNGSGWGNSLGPKPIATHPAGNGYGVGEPSMVIVDDKLYIYYTYADGPNNQTRVMTTTVGYYWPNHLTNQGVAIDRTGTSWNTGGSGGGDMVEDSTDVKYVDTLGKFIGVATGNRFTSSDFLKVYESTDGLKFTTAVITRGDWQPGMHNLGISGTPQGHLDVNDDNFIAYADQPFGRAWARWPTRLSPITLGSVHTGAVSATVGNALASWTPEPGDAQYWGTAGDGALMASNDLTATLAGATLTNYAFGDAVYDVDVNFPVHPKAGAWAGFRFAQIKPTDVWGQSGYLLRLEPDGTVDLWKAHGSGYEDVSSNVATGTNPVRSYVHLRVVKSGPVIAVFVGNTVVPQITWLDPIAPYMGGSVSLESGGATTQFYGFTVSDNIPAGPARSADWLANTGSWSVQADGSIKNTSSHGQFNLSTTRASTPGSTQTFSAPWAGGDGTYRATLRIDPGSDLTAWAGVNLVNSSYGNMMWNASTTNSGYLVFLRRNGKLGLYKYGAGQMVADVETGLTPVAAPVDLRIVKRGRNIKVFVGNAQVPAINYDDSVFVDQDLGGLGLVSLAPATFSNVGYDANNPRP